VERDVGTAVDPLGGHIPEVAKIHDRLPCYVQARSASTITNSGRYISIGILMMWAPLDADLQAEDIVTGVTDLAGRVLHEGKRRVVAPPLRRETHLEATLEEYS